jgi:uncharacterized damage-inducible protein DinB
MTMLRGWLRHLRGSVNLKLEGLDDDQIRWKPAETTNSLGAIAMHLGYVERLLLRATFAGEEMDTAWTDNRYARTFMVPEGWSAADVIAFYQAETAAADAVLDRATSLDEPSAAADRPTTLRWVVTHLVEATARRLGYMHLTRELIDGASGP